MDLRQYRRLITRKAVGGWTGRASAGSYGGNTRVCTRWWWPEEWACGRDNGWVWRGAVCGVTVVTLLRGYRQYTVGLQLLGSSWWELAGGRVRLEVTVHGYTAGETLHCTAITVRPCCISYLRET